MIECNLDAVRSILYVRPLSALNEDDFTKLASTIDSYIEATGKLDGLVIQLPRFPGWENFAAMTAHLRFVRDHHRHIKKVAVITDSMLGGIAEHLASHFVSADIKRFSTKEDQAAREWILDPREPLQHH